MTRGALALLACITLVAGCAKMETAPSSATTGAPARAAADAAPRSDAPLPSPLLSQPGSALGSGGNSHEVCLQQCEHSYSVCMDGTSARADVTSGTMYESRLFGPASRCERSLKQCLTRCGAATK